jgi:DUF1009 family protein
MDSAGKIGLIAGNGKFPLLVLEAARAQGYEVVVAAIKEEAFAEIAEKGAVVHWLSLGELSKLIDTFKRAGVTRAVMAGQVKHKQIFSAIKPDVRMMKLLMSLALRNTDSLLGAVCWRIRRRCWSRCWRGQGCGRGGGRRSRRGRILGMGGRWRGVWRSTTLGRRW